MSTWLLAKLVSAWLLPPGIFILLGFGGLIAARKHRRLGTCAVALSFVLLYACSTQWLANTLLKSLEPATYTDPLTLAPAQAIVVLGGGRYRGAPEYGGDTVSEPTLVRLRYGAHLHRVLNKPLLVSGGKPDGGTASEAETMKSVLEKEFNVPVTWMESTSNTTLEQARDAMAVLAPQGIRRIYLVTHAWHMPRSQAVFTQAGFDVAPAPTKFTSRREVVIKDFMPEAAALRDTNYYFHEMLGLAWYRLKSPAK